jgi:hypothetical protein
VIQRRKPGSSSSSRLHLLGTEALSIRIRSIYCDGLLLLLLILWVLILGRCVLLLCVLLLRLLLNGWLIAHSGGHGTKILSFRTA